jgi:hypothetical protein
MQITSYKFAQIFFYYSAILNYTGKAGKDGTAGSPGRNGRGGRDGKQGGRGNVIEIILWPVLLNVYKH